MQEEPFLVNVNHNQSSYFEYASTFIVKKLVVTYQYLPVGPSCDYKRLKQVFKCSDYLCFGTDRQRSMPVVAVSHPLD